MKTTQDRRAAMREDVVAYDGGKTRVSRDFIDLIADVDAAAGLLGEWMNGKELPPNWTDRVRDFLKEPKQ